MYYGASATVAGTLATAATVGCAATAVGVAVIGVNKAAETVTGRNSGEELIGEKAYQHFEAGVSLLATTITSLPQTNAYPSTGRSEPQNLGEQIGMKLTKMAPKEGTVIILSLDDPCMPGWLGWQKYQIGFKGTNVNIHYVGNKFMPIFFDFKFK